MYVDFTQYNQAIPSPWGMPVFEFVDFEDPASFFLNYAEYDTVTTPNFSGDRVSSYLQLKNFASHLQYFKRAFPTIKDKKVPFHLCPDELDVDSLVEFTERCHTTGAK